MFHYPLHFNGFPRIWSCSYVELPDISPVGPLNVSVGLPIFCERQDLNPRSQRAIGQVSGISTSFRSTAICHFSCIVRGYTNYQHNRLGRLLADPLAPKGCGRRMGLGRAYIWAAVAVHITANGSNKTQMPLDWLVFGSYVV
jgi:hypothetical protein